MLASRPAAKWLERLRAADILCGPINTFADVVADADLVQNKHLVDPMAVDVPMAVGAPIRLNGAYTATVRPAPAKGEHTREILAELGFSRAETEAFLRDGVAFIADDDQLD